MKRLLLIILLLAGCQLREEEDGSATMQICTPDLAQCLLYQRDAETGEWIEVGGISATTSP